MISKHSYKVSKDNLKMGNIPFSYGVNLLLLFLHAHEGGTSHNLLYVRQMYIPFHLSISPEAHIEVSHLKGEENEPRHSDSTVPSVRQITSQFYFFKDFAPELLGCLDGSVGWNPAFGSGHDLRVWAGRGDYLRSSAPFAPLLPPPCMHTTLLGGRGGGEGRGEEGGRKGGRKQRGARWRNKLIQNIRSTQISDSKPRQRGESTTFTHTLRQY